MGRGGPDDHRPRGLGGKRQVGLDSLGEHAAERERRRGEHQYRLSRRVRSEEVRRLRVGDDDESEEADGDAEQFDRAEPLVGKPQLREADGQYRNQPREHRRDRARDALLTDVLEGAIPRERQDPGRGDDRPIASRPGSPVVGAPRRVRQQKRRADVESERGVQNRRERLQPERHRGVRSAPERRQDGEQDGAPRATGGKRLTDHGA